MTERFLRIGTRVSMATLAAVLASPALAEPTATGAVDRMSGMANEATGTVKQGLGELTDDAGLRAEGRTQELRGRAQQALGEAKDEAENAKHSR